MGILGVIRAPLKIISIILTVLSPHIMHRIIPRLPLSITFTELHIYQYQLLLPCEEKLYAIVRKWLYMYYAAHSPLLTPAGHSPGAKQLLADW